MGQMTNDELIELLKIRVEIDSDENKYWFRCGLKHRDDGPAVEMTNGDKEWNQNGELHRDDGPAVEMANGDKAWYQNGQCYKIERGWKKNHD